MVPGGFLDVSWEAPGGLLERSWRASGRPREGSLGGFPEGSWSSFGGSGLFRAMSLKIYRHLSRF